MSSSGSDTGAGRTFAPTKPLFDLRTSWLGVTSQGRAQCSQVVRDHPRSRPTNRLLPEVASFLELSLASSLLFFPAPARFFPAPILFLALEVGDSLGLGCLLESIDEFREMIFDCSHLLPSGEEVVIA